MTLFGGLVFIAFLTSYTTFVCCVVIRMFQLEGVAAAAAVAEGWGSKNKSIGKFYKCRGQVLDPQVSKSQAIPRGGVGVRF